MECLKCKTEMITASLCGSTYPVWLRNKKPGLLEPEHLSSVSCFVCPACGYVELKADDPKKLILR